jgi:hypothetical protein
MPSNTYDKRKEYDIRYSFWTEKAITQFGYSINLFTTIGISSLFYLLSKKEIFPTVIIKYSYQIDWKLLFYLLSILFILISIIYGFISISSRLYDFRITRHLSLSRKRFLNRSKSREDNGLIKDIIITTPKGKDWKYFKEIIFNDINFINEDDIINERAFLDKFREMQLKSNVLGKISWKAHKTQIIIFIIGLIFYGLTAL